MPADSPIPSPFPIQAPRPLAPLGFAAELAARERPVILGLAGVGQMGIDILVEVALMAGVRVGALSTTRPQAAIEACLLAGHRREDIVVAGSAAEADRAIEAQKLAIVEHFSVLAEIGHVEAVVDATGSPAVGTEVALAAIRGGKHIVMLNVEADITIGRALKAEARRAGVVYTGAAGDEPAATLDLIAFAQSIGLEIVAAGKGKNNAFDINAVPADFEVEARARNMNPRVLVEFVDGTKTMVEMTAIANCTGLVPDVPGMHGPDAGLDTLAQTLCTREDGGILSRSGVVDYTIGKGVAPGVFCIAKPRHPRVLERMADLKVGPGPCFSLVRPFHLTSLEVPLSAARAVMHGRPDMQPLDHPVAECACVAKRDLPPGTVLGRIGMADYRGFAMTWADARREGALPIGLAEGSTVTRPVRAGERLTYANCRPDETLSVTRIRQALDESDRRFLA